MNLKSLPPTQHYGFRLKVHPLFIVFALLAICFGYALVFLNYMAVILLHEMAHSYVASKLGYSLKNFILLPQGAQVSGIQAFEEPMHEIKVAAAGPVFNIFLALATVSLWWLVPDSFAMTENFAVANTATAALNLLPVLPLDGGRIFVAAFDMRGRRMLGTKVSRAVGVVIAAFLLGIFIYSVFVKVNFSYLAMAVFLALPLFNKSNENIYVQTHRIINKAAFKKTGVGKVNAFMIYSHQTLAVLARQLCKNRFNVAYVVDEISGDVVASIFETEIFAILQNHPLNQIVRQAIN